MSPSKNGNLLVRNMSGAGYQPNFKSIATSTQCKGCSYAQRCRKCFGRGHAATCPCVEGTKESNPDAALAMLDIKPSVLSAQTMTTSLNILKFTSEN
ncbi:hypothetical protein V2J09_016656 [Rumex salicifolius]